MSEKRKFGDIEFIGKDIGSSAKFDRLAISGRGELLLLSCFAESQRVKAIRAILNGGAKATVQAAGVKVNSKGEDAWRAHSPGRLSPTSESYHLYQHKIGFGLVHALFITRMQGFLKVVTEESLWQELKNIRFTTPILREWMPYIEKELRAGGYLEDAQVFNCDCGVLSATTASLDAVVSTGLANRDILIEKPVVV